MQRKICNQVSFLSMTFPARLAASSPFNFFVNKSYSVKETHEDPLSLVFPDLLHPKLGEIVESVQVGVKMHRCELSHQGGSL